MKKFIVEKTDGKKVVIEADRMSRHEGAIVLARRNITSTYDDVAVVSLAHVFGVFEEAAEPKPHSPAK